MNSVCIPVWEPEPLTDLVRHLLVPLCPKLVQVHFAASAAFSLPAAWFPLEPSGFLCCFLQELMDFSL